MTEAYIYDAVRTPRGKGRKDGALHEVTSLRLSALTLNALKARNGLDGHAVGEGRFAQRQRRICRGDLRGRAAAAVTGLISSSPKLA